MLFRHLRLTIHEKYGKHKPGLKLRFDGTNLIGWCKVCDKEIIKDNSGNWVESK